MLKQNHCYNDFFNFFNLVIQPHKEFNYFTNESENYISPGFLDFAKSENTVIEVVPIKTDP